MSKETKRTWSYILLSVLIIAAYAAGNWMGAERAYGDIKKDYKKLQVDIDLMKAIIPDIKEDGDKLREILDDIEREIKMRISWNRETVVPSKIVKPRNGE